MRGLCVGVCVCLCVFLQIKKSKHNAMTPRSEIPVLLLVVDFIFTGLVVMMAKVLYVHIWSEL